MIKVSNLQLTRSKRDATPDCIYCVTAAQNPPLQRPFPTLFNRGRKGHFYMMSPEICSVENFHFKFL